MFGVSGMLGSEGQAGNGKGSSTQVLRRWERGIFQAERNVGRHRSRDFGTRQCLPSALRPRHQVMMNGFHCDAKVP